MSDILTITEHQEIEVSKNRNIKESKISYEDRELLFAMQYRDRDDKIRQVFVNSGKNKIKAKSIVGSISIKNGLTIEILPKILQDDLTSENIKKCRKILLNIIKVSNERNFVSTVTQSSKISVCEMPLISYIIELFTENLLHTLRSGLFLSYEKKIQNSNQIKGNILVSKTIQNNIIDKSKVYTSYNKHTINNLLMQVFKALVLMLRDDSNISHNAKQNLYEIHLLLSDVKHIKIEQQDFEKITFNRLNDKYENIFNQAKFIYNKYMPFSAKINSTPFWSILFNMDTLFEKFIAYLLKKSNVSFNIQYSKDVYKNQDYTVTARPDFVFYDDKNIVSVADTKWKILDNSKTLYGLNAQNFWQLYSYMNLLNDTQVNGYFIVPKINNNLDDSISFDPININDKKIKIISIDFSLDFEDIVELHSFELINNELSIIKKEKIIPNISQLSISDNATNNVMKNMTIKEAILKSLNEIQNGSTEDIYNHILQKKYYVFGGNTPQGSVSGQLSELFNKDKKIYRNDKEPFIYSVINNKFDKDTKNLDDLIDDYLINHIDNEDSLKNAIKIKLNNKDYEPNSLQKNNIINIFILFDNTDIERIIQYFKLLKDINYPYWLIFELNTLYEEKYFKVFVYIIITFYSNMKDMQIYKNIQAKLPNYLNELLLNRNIEHNLKICNKDYQDILNAFIYNINTQQYVNINKQIIKITDNIDIKIKIANKCQIETILIDLVQKMNDIKYAVVFDILIKRNDLTDNIRERWLFSSFNLNEKTILYILNTHYKNKHLLSNFIKNLQNNKFMQERLKNILKDIKNIEVLDFLFAYLSEIESIFETIIEFVSFNNYKCEDVGNAYSDLLYKVCEDSIKTNRYKRIEKLAGNFCINKKTVKLIFDNYQDEQVIGKFFGRHCKDYHINSVFYENKLREKIGQELYDEISQTFYQDEYY